MKKTTLFRICNWCLLCLTPAILCSSIQLELRLASKGFIWAHIAIGLIFFIIIGWHLRLHYQWKGIAKKLMHSPKMLTRWLAIFGSLTLLTAIVATSQTLHSWHHSPIGGWHGKIGFFFIALAIAHIIRHRVFYRHK